MKSSADSAVGLGPIQTQGRRQEDARAVRRACKRAGVPIWTPGQLRHNAGTKIRADFDLEAARVGLGHAHASTTEIYAKRDSDKNHEVFEKLG